MSEKSKAMRLSKRMAFVLRHNPASVGLALDEHGWVPLEALCAALSASKAEVLAVAAEDSKARYTVAGGRIRAAQGHSVAVDLEHPVATPPAVLYHGTVAAALPGIGAEGLVPGSRLAVHLSPDVETAKVVGARRGQPIILSVKAQEMAAAGHEFRRSENGVWLVAHVPVEFISFPE